MRRASSWTTGEEAFAVVGIDLVGLLAQRLGIADERRQRRAQLVAGVGDEIDAHLLGGARLAAIDEADQARAVGEPRGAHQPMSGASRRGRSARLPRRRRGRRSSASSAAGWAMARSSGAPSSSAPSSARAAALAARTRPRGRDERGFAEPFEQSRHACRSRSSAGKRPAESSASNCARHRARPRRRIMASKFETFAALHVPGDPVILYNIWDVGSARAVVAAGAKALATGSHPVGDANGFGDAQQVPIDYAFANARRIVEAVELPLTVDFEGAYSSRPRGGRGECRAARRDRRRRLQFRGPGGRRRGPPPARPAGEANRGDPAARSATASSSTRAPTCS